MPHRHLPQPPLSRRLARGASVLAVSAALALGTPQGALAQGQTPVPAGFEEMVAEKLPAVVGILSTRNAPQTDPRLRPQLPPGLGEFFGFGPRPDAPPPGPMRAQGSGFIISGDGYIVTNNHVIAGGDSIDVVLEDEQRFEAELIGTDPATDIALLKIEADEELPVVEWGASADLQIGEWLVAIGNPFGLGGTVTAGILSARSRDINSGPYDDFLQTDAAINSGNSGGPLFNAGGEVIGVNTAIFSPSGGNVGIGFAVPSSVARSVVADLREDGVVERGYLGVQIQPVGEDLAEALGLTDDIGDPGGALVAEVSEGSPADAAGIEPGDVIVELASAQIQDPRDLTFGVAELAVGTETTITVFRDGERRELSVEIGQQPGSLTMAAAPQAESDAATPRLGVSVAPMSEELRQRFGIPAEVDGVVVSAVTSGSPAAEAGLRAGDVIVAAAGTEITGTQALREAVAEAGDRPLLLRVFSNGSYTFRAVRLDEASDG